MNPLHMGPEFARLAGLCAALALLAGAFGAGAAPGARPEEPRPEAVIPLWPGMAPGDKGDLPDEADTTKPNQDKPPVKRITRLGNVSNPTLALYRPAKGKANGAAVVVCPGGGYSILAMDLEGSEVCQWLNTQGVTAFLLKYRVPGRAGQEKHAAALQDAQRALGIVRFRAKEWGVDPKRVGLLGFSAGGHLTATASNTFAARLYPVVDGADRESCRPDFTVLVYPAYLTTQDGGLKLAPEVKVTADTPPAFVAMTQDDAVRVENAFAYAAALHAVKVPVELHVWPKGGHGYGLRPSENPVSKWPERLAEWLNAGGWLKPRP